MEKKKLELSQAEEALTSPDDDVDTKRVRIDELVKEAQEQTTLKQTLEANLKRAHVPQRARGEQLRRITADLSIAENTLDEAKRRLEEKRQDIITKAGSAESEAARRTERLKDTEDKLAKAREDYDSTKQAVANAYRAFEELSPQVDLTKQRVSEARRKCMAVEAKIRELESNSNSSVAMFGQRCSKVKQMVR